MKKKTTPRIFGNRYRVTAAPLSGGTGTVFICDDPNLDRRVAVKFMQSPRDKRRVYDEIAALQRIRSKHVVQIYDVVIEQPDNQIGIVQEYLPGVDVRAFVNPPPDDETYLRLLYQIASGIDDIHQEGLIHRDIKPNNMKFDQEKLVRIFDFDLSREDGEEAKTTGFRGTRGFAAPELYTFGPVTFTQAVDVYAFGATALYCAINDLPKELLENPPNTDLWVTFEGFSSVRPRVPKPITDLLDRCLNPDPLTRPRMADVRVALADHLLAGQHRALVISGASTHICDQDPSRRAVRLTWDGVGEIVIGYDMHRFVVTKVSGEVSVNRQPVVVGMEISGSCVIMLGDPPRSWTRKFITFDVSHPEVVL